MSDLHFHKPQAFLRRLLTGALALSLAGSLLCTTAAMPLQAFAAEEGGGVDYYAEAEERKSEPAETNELDNWPPGPSIGAESAVLMDVQTGAVLYAKNSHEHLYPASITKIMTALLAFEHLSPSRMVSFSEEAVFGIERDSSNIGIDIGEELSAKECMYALMIASANEVAMALAEEIGGSVSHFASMMNERAAELGCTDTHFVNPHGLHDDDHYTCAYDMALISREFFSHDNLAEYANMVSYHFEPTDTQPDDFYVNNKHMLINGTIDYDGIVGGKTGFTSISRQTLVTCCERDGIRLVCVVMKEESPGQFDDTTALFDYGFSNFHKLRISDYEQSYLLDDPAFMQKGQDLFGSKTVPLSIAQDSYVMIPETLSFEDLSTEFLYDAASVESGVIPVDEAGNRIIGTLQYSYGGFPVGGAQLLFTDDSAAAVAEAASEEGTPAEAEAVSGAEQGTADAQTGEAAYGEAQASDVPLASDHATVTQQTGIVDGIRTFLENILHSSADGTLFVDIPALLFLVILAAGALIVFLLLIAYIRHLHRRGKKRRRLKRRRQAEQKVREELIHEWEERRKAQDLQDR